MLLPTLLLTTSLASTCLTPKAQPLLNGWHQRFDSAQGPVHLWCRDGEGPPELLVVYVHGYYDTVDDAFAQHGLIEQFAASGLNLLVAMVEGPTGPNEPVRWEQWSALERELSAQVAVPLPSRLVVLAHSGGNRTARAWLTDARIDDVVLLDAFYGSPAPWARWLEHRPEARLELVGVLTATKAGRWQQSLKPSLARRVVRWAAATDHMGVVTDGVWVPKVLQSRVRAATR